MNIVRITVVVLVASLSLQIVPTQAHAVDFTGRVLGGTSTGFTTISSETAFLTNIEGDYFFDENISLGGQVLFAISDILIMAPQAVGKYTFHINENNFENLKPHIQGLMGFVISDNTDTEVGFLGGFGFGADYFLKSNFSLGTDMLFEFSNELAGKNFGWFWKVFTVKYLF